MTSNRNTQEMSTLDGFFERLKAASSSILMLDYDGTLAPFTADRMAAYPYPGIPERMATILQSPSTRCVLITGRSIDHIYPLLNLDPLPEVWGSHGWELLTTEKKRIASPLNTQQKDFLKKWNFTLDKVLPPNCIEKKPYSIAIHWRGIAPDITRQIKDQIDHLWEQIGNVDLARLTPFNQGVEICLRGKTKGNAVDEILKEASPTAISAYLGDDFTDEDAFLALGNRGLKALVSTEHRPSAADIHLIPPDELLAFLDRWIAVTQSGSQTP